MLSAPEDSRETIVSALPRLKRFARLARDKSRARLTRPFARFCTPPLNLRSADKGALAGGAGPSPRFGYFGGPCAASWPRPNWQAAPEARPALFTRVFLALGRTFDRSRPAGPFALGSSAPRLSSTCAASGRLSWSCAETRGSTRRRHCLRRSARVVRLRSPYSECLHDFYKLNILRYAVEIAICMVILT